MEKYRTNPDKVPDKSRNSPKQVQKQSLPKGLDNKMFSISLVLHVRRWSSTNQQFAPEILIIREICSLEPAPKVWKPKSRSQNVKVMFEYVFCSVWSKCLKGTYEPFKSIWKDNMDLWKPLHGLYRQRDGKTDRHTLSTECVKVC